MKTRSTSNPRTLSRSPFTSLLAIVAVCLSVGTAWTADAQSDLFATINNNGTAFNADGAVFQYTPAGIPSTIVSSFERPHGLTFDSTGNLFVTSGTVDDPSGIHGTIFKITPDGIMSTFASGFAANFFLQTVVFDSAGNLFVVAEDESSAPFPSTIFKITPDGTVSTFGSVPSLSLSLAFDGAGNLFASDGVDQIIYKFTPGGMRSIFAGPAAFTSTKGPAGLAFDGFGDLFVSTEDLTGNGQGAILKFTPGGTEILPTFATGLTNNPRGLAFDSAGNLFVAEIPSTTTGDILKFTPGGTGTVGSIVPASGGVAYFAQGIGRPSGNGGPEFLAFPPPNTPVASNVTTAVTLTSEATSPGTTRVTPIADPSSVGPLPTGVDATNAVAFDITTTATYTPPIIIAVQLPLFAGDLAAFNQLQILHWNGASWDNVTASDPARDFQTKTIYASAPTLSPFVVAKETLSAQVQQPINADGSSVFSVKRGVVPVVFTLTSNGVATCQLPRAKISVIRTAGGVVGSIDESTYLSKADKGSNFRISNCQYVYNLAASSLGTGTYKVNISIGGTVVGSGTFALK